MPGKPVSKVQRQVAKAGRRLFAQTLLDSLVWCWAAALLLSTAWFLLEPLLFDAPVDWLRWAVAGGFFAIATATGVWLTFRRAPSSVEAALELDQRFKLKERATTSLTLAPELTQTPAGQALAADAEAHVGKVDVRQGFPVRLTWTAIAVPVCAVVLTLVALFYKPVFDSSQAAAAQAKKVTNAKQIAEAFDKLKNPPSLAWPKEDKSKELDEIEKLNDKLFKQMFDASDKDKVREMSQKMVTLEDKIKNRLEDLLAQQDRNKAMQDKLKDFGKDPAQKLKQEGPAKDLEDALNDGDLAKAQKELKDLAEKLKDDMLTDEQRQQLQKQLDDIQKMLNNVADLQGLKDQLMKDLKAGNLSQEEFDKLMAALREDAELLQDLKELSGKIGECKECLIGGDLKDAAKKMAALAKDLKDFDPEGKEMMLLQQQQLALAEARARMQQGLNGGGPPGGQRPVAEDAITGAKAEKQKGVLDKNSPFRITGEQKGGMFNKIPPSQVGGAFQKAQQEAPQAIERQQVPQDAAEMIRGFYENLGGGQKK